MKNSYTEEELKSLLVNKFNDLGRLPTKNEINSDPKMPNASTYLDRLGGVQKLAGILGLTVSRFNDLSLDVFVKLATQFHEKTGLVPSVSDFDNTPGFPHSSYLRDSLGINWNSFLSLCNLPAFTRGEVWVKNRKAELHAKEMLLGSGYKVHDLSEENINAPHSFIINDKITIDVRYSSWVSEKRTSQVYWKFKLHLRDKLKSPDYFICIGYDDNGNNKSTFLFPTNELTAAEVISINPNRIERSKYAKYLVENLEL